MHILSDLKIRDAVVKTLSTFTLKSSRYLRKHLGKHMRMDLFNKNLKGSVSLQKANEAAYGLYFRQY